MGRLRGQLLFAGDSSGSLSRVIATFATALIVLTLGGLAAVWALLARSSELVDTMNEQLEAIANESTEVTSAYLDIGESSGRIIVETVRVNDRTLEDDALGEAFFGIVSAHESINSAYIASANGDVLFAAKPVDSDPYVEFLAYDGKVDSYDPRTRPWYEDALVNEIGWTSPYAFATSEAPGVTHFVVARDDEGRIVGIVGLDLSLARLSTFLSERLPSPNGQAFIAGPDGTIIASANPESEVSEPLKDLIPAKARTLDQEWFDGAERNIAVLAPVGGSSEWTLVVSAPESDFQSPYATQLEALRGLLPLLGLGIVLGAIVAAISALRRVDRLRQEATIDPLTGILNGSAVRDRLAKVLEEDGPNQLAVLAIDLKNFNKVNERWGRDVGDLALRTLAARLSDALDGRGFVGRLGGDQFLAVLTVTTRRDQHGVVQGLISKVLDEPVVSGDIEIDLSAHCGFSLCEPGGSHDELSLVRDADVALLTAKANEPDVVRFATDMNVPSLSDTARRAELIEHVANDDFEFHFQPEVDLASGRIIGAEALLRLRMPDQTLVDASTFIADVERLQIINLLTPKLFEAGRGLARQVDDPSFVIRLNMCAEQLADAATIDALAEVNKRTDVRWCIEITERTVVEFDRITIKRLERLVKHGVTLALDDFGTGYSSFAELANLPIDTIKIDQSFVAQLTGSNADTSLTSVIVDAASRLGLGVVAEGIETEEQHQALRLIGCRQGQGWLFGEAVPIEEFVSADQGVGAAKIQTSLSIRR